jgi:hypothetical protein
MPWGHIRCCRRNFKNGSFDWKLNGLVSCSTIESDWRAINPLLTPTFSPNKFSQNFEIVILLNVVKRSGNYVFEDDKPPAVPWAKAISYAWGHIRFFIEKVGVETSKWAHSIGN